MELTQFFKCLADDTRLKIMMLIQREQELCVCELMVALQESQSKISRHLALLRKCDLLLVRRQSQWAYYRLNPNLAFWIREVINLSTKHNDAFLQDNIRKLKTMVDRPEGTKNCCYE
ncbi:MAG TPA: metalloregulator ArsR/SmtB family transcription factor [Psychromonas sp.]